MNKKLTKLLSVFLIAGAIGMGTVANAGCVHKHTFGDNWVTEDGATTHWHPSTCGHDVKGDETAHADTNGDNKCDDCNAAMPEEKPNPNPGGDTATVTSVKISAANGATSVKVGETLQLSAVVSGTNNPSQEVTWTSSDTNTATVDGNGLVTGKAAGSVEITATSTLDKTKSDKITLTVATAISSDESDNAIVPEFKGPAEGPKAGTSSKTFELNGADIEKGTLAEDWTDGIFTIAKGAEIRDRKPTGDNASNYSRSIKNGSITIAVPSTGKLKFVFANGSTSKSSKYKITGPGLSGDEGVISTGDKVLNGTEIDVVQGEYKFVTTDGTVDMFGIELALDGVAATPIQSLEIASAGTTDYLVTQKVDCTGIKLVAKDGNNVTYDVDLTNCKFDTSKYNPNVSGEYEIGITYYLDSNLDSNTTEFTASYKVKVYAVDSIKLDTIGLSGSNQLTAQQAYLTTDTYVKETNLSVVAECDLNGDKITYKLKKDWYTLTDAVDLSTPGKKTITVNVNTAYTVGNKEVKTSYEIISAAKKDVVENKVTVTVGTNGDFSTLTQAVQYLSKCDYADNVVKVIEIAPGTYEEKVWIEVNNVVLVGKGTTADDTKITYSLVEGDIDNLSGAYWGLNCATVHVKGKNFKAYNVAIHNDFDYMNNAGNYSGNQAAQGVALTLDTDGAVIYGCHLYGNQDTLYMKTGRSYYYKTQIDGNIDFIFGGDTGLAYFEECVIKAVSRTAAGNDQNGYVTAAKHDANKKPDYGYIFDKCTLTAYDNVKEGSMSLGRPWGAAATVAYINCNFSKHYSKLASDSDGKNHRWNSMSGANPEDADFCEYGSTGEGAITTAVKGGSVLTAEKAANYTKTNIFGTANGAKVGYSAAWDCDVALSTLKIIAGLEEGEIPEDKTVTINLKDNTFTDGNCAADLNSKYGDYFEWTGTAKFQNQDGKIENGVQIGTDTVITFKVVGEVTLVQGYELPVTDYEITYKDGYATVTFVAATGTYGTFIGEIIIDTSKTMPDTQRVDVTFDYNDEGATQSKVESIIVGKKVTKPADPVRSGYTFKYWYKGDDDSTEYDFDSVVEEAFTLKAKWEAGEVATEYTAGSVINITQLTKTYQAGTDTTTGLELGVLIDATSGKIAPNGDNVQFTTGAIIKVKVAEGLMVLPVWHKLTPQDGFTVSERDGDGYVTITSYNNGTYIIQIMVVSAYSIENGGTLTFGTTNEGMGASYQGHYASNGTLTIDATASGAKVAANTNYAQVNQGTVIKLKAPDSVTDVSGVTIKVTAYNNVDITDKYTLTYEDGYIVLTATSNSHPDCYPSTIEISID